jgi:hypothetical protein
MLAASAGDTDNGGGFFVSRGVAPTGEREVVLTEPALHYEFVPGLDEASPHEAGGFGWCWMQSASDDIGTEYSDNNGAFDSTSGGAATHCSRDIGGQIQPDARRLTIQFEPVEGWTPPGPWRCQIVVDLQDKRLVD